MKNWPRVLLGDICEFKYGKSLPEPKRSGSGFPVYGSNGIVGWHEQSLTTGPTIIVGRKGSFGEVNYSSQQCYPIDTTYYIDESNTKVHLKWLAHLLASLGLTHLNRASTIPGLNREDAYRKVVALPPPEEQRRIADVLDRADALRVKRQEAIEKIDSLGQAIFLEMFGDVKSNSKGFPIQSLKDCVTVKSGYAFKSSDYVESGIPLIRIGEVNRGIDPDDICFLPQKLESTLSRFIIRPNAILMSLTGTVGKDDYGNVVVLSDRFEKYFLNQRVAELKPAIDTIHPTFLFAFLRVPEVKKQLTDKSRGVRQANISNGDLLELKILVPPLALQKKFADFIQNLNRTSTRMKHQLTNFDQLFLSLQNRLLRGDKQAH